MNDVILPDPEVISEVTPEALTKPKQHRGFAAMSPEKRRMIAAKGGGSVPAHKRSFARDKELAERAGRKGGENGKGSAHKRSEA